ncbi:MAG: hypothetical protein Q8M76_05230 [Spirochaetaceae bacterium]|nr:hypothetical protein [Spirochaetaceae bacterium]
MAPKVQLASPFVSVDETISSKPSKASFSLTPGTAGTVSLVSFWAAEFAIAMRLDSSTTTTGSVIISIGASRARRSGDARRSRTKP